MFRISVENLGPIGSGEVDIKPLTIFIGPSNTGKSYMAGAIWALMKGFEGHYDNSFFRNIGRESRFRRLRSASRFRRNLDTDGGYVESLNSLRNWIEHNGNSLEELSQLQIPALPQEIQALLKQSTQQLLIDMSRFVVAQLRHVHGDDQDFARNGATDGFSLTISQYEPQLNLGIDLTGKDTWLAEVDISRFEVPSPWFETLELREDPELAEHVPAAILRSLQASVATRLLEGFPQGTYYLPAARSGMVQSHKVLSAALVRRSPMIGLERVDIPTLPGITADFLGDLISLDQRMGTRKIEPAIAEAIGYIENAVLGGEIDIDDSSGLPFPDIAYYQGVGYEPRKKFLINNSSSMVSELAPVVLFLKYLVFQDDLLIFEEPESHLHPAAQRRLARGIARLVNAGVRVLITTHSDTFVSQINNLIGLGQASAGFASEHNLQPQEFLTLDQVGAYLFSIGQDGEGSGVRPLEIDPDTGIDEDEFADVFEAIYEESIALQRDRS